jgi:hypothetical protein
MIEISKTNIVPKWGLDNGALGTAINISFEKEKIQMIYTFLWL